MAGGRASARAAFVGAGAVIGLAALVCAASPAWAQPAPTWYSRGTDMAPRLQWNANDGYCGETSFISAGMRLGQYTSQWTARSIASPGIPEYKSSAQLLIGSNDLRAARGMRLEATRFNDATQRSVPQFLAWVKQHFLAGDSVIIGVLNNTTILNEPGPGDRQYDHIVPVFGIGSAVPLGASAGQYRATDTITISDNGLHNVGPNYPYLYTYRFADFPLARAQANAPGGPVYALRAWPKSFGTAVTGVADPDGVTIPIRLSSDANGEGVQNEPVLKHRPAASPISLTAHVSIPDPAVAYRVYMYDRFGTVPARHFNAKASKAVTSWVIPAHSGDHWRVTVQAMSNQTRVFRAVPVSAP